MTILIPKKLAAALIGLGALSLLPAAQARVEEARVYTCDTTVAPQSALQVEDQSSLAGAQVENATVITLANGMKAVQFSVRYAKRMDLSGRLLKFRYTVEWLDDCGRRITVGANMTDGLILSRNQYRTVQSTAMHRDASRAILRTYVEID